MAKFDAEMMKKQHFWLLLIPIALGLLLAWIGLFMGVSSATEEKAAANKKEQDAINTAKAQPKKTLDLYEERKKELFVLRTKRWEEMWDIQKGIYGWPKSIGEEQVKKVEDLKFGTEISDPSLLAAFRDHYAKEYDVMATEAGAVQFSGGSWRSVLRHVPTWTRNPESEDVWLAVEDFWVQREIVNALAQVNKDAGQFQQVKSDKDDPMSRTFQNRIWRVELKLVTRGSAMVVQGTITNLSDRLQAYNANNALMLNLWLTPEGDSRPFLFAIEGASLEGGKSEPIKFVEKKHTVFEGTPRGIYRVEQVYDIRTAPVKRVDRLELGYTSARHNKAELQMSAFSTAAAAAEGAAAGVAPGSTPGAPVGPSTGGGPPGPGGRGGMSTPGAGNDGAGAGPADRTFNGLVRRRYIHLTAQVRAVPVGMTIIADQAYVQDVLTAIANSKIRFQTVQTHLARFRSSLAYSTTGSSSGPMPPGGMEGSGPMPPTPGGPGFGGAGGAPMPPRGGPAVGVPGFGGPGFGGPGFGGPPTGGFGGPANAPRSSNEDTVASNLIELSIYGIASLYEKFDPNAVKDGSTTVTPKENVTPNEKMPEAKVPPREVAPTDPNAIPDKGDPKDGPAKNDSAIDPKVVPGKGEPKEVPAKNEPAIDPKGSNKQ